MSLTDLQYARNRVTQLEIMNREQEAEIDMLRNALGTAGERINTQDAEIDRLKKVADQAIKRGDLRMATPRDEGRCQLTQQLPVWEDWDRELYAYLNEKSTTP